MIFAYYNGVHFRDVRVERFDQSVLYDESNTDLVFSKISITMTANLTDYKGALLRNGNDTPEGMDARSIYPNSVSVNGSYSLSDRMRHLKKVLQFPRGDFWLVVGGQQEFADGPSLYLPLVVSSGFLYRWHEGDPNYPAGAPIVPPDPTSGNPSIPYDQIAKLPPPYRTGVPTGDQLLPRHLYVDLEGGPSPTEVSIQQLYGGRVLRCSFSIDVSVLSCDFAAYPPDYPGPGYHQGQEAGWWATNIFKGTKQTGDLPTGGARTGNDDINRPVDAPPGPHFVTPGNEVISNKWSITESQDEGWFTTREITGQLRTKRPEFFAQFFRKLVVPPLARGYKRIQQRFISDPTDTNLNYTIVDRQIQAAPPWPAIEWEGNMSIGLSQLGGKQACSFNLTLTGAPGVNKLALMETGLQVLTKRIPDLQKLNVLFPNAPKDYFWTKVHHLACTDIIGKPQININAQALLNLPLVNDATTGKFKQDRFLNVAWKWMFDDSRMLEIEDYDPSLMPVPIPYDSLTPVGLFRNYLQQPCSYYHGVPQIRQDLPPDRVYNPGHYHRENNDAGPYNPVDGWKEGDHGEPGVIKDQNWTPPPTSEEGELGEQVVVDDIEELTPLFIQYTSRIPADIDRMEKSLDEAPSGSSDKVLYDQQDNPYNEYALSSRYELPQGKMQLPYAFMVETETDPGPPPVTEQKTAGVYHVHAGIARRIVTVKATRDGAFPVIPQFPEERTDVNGIKETLIDLQINPQAPIMAPDGYTRTYGCDMVAIYALSRPPTAEEQLEVGSNATDAADPVEHYFNFKKHLDRLEKIYNVIVPEEEEPTT